MRKILLIASREFLAVVATRGFIIGSLVVPALMTLTIFAMPRLMGQRDFSIVGEVAVIDPTGLVAAALRETADPAKLEQRRRVRARRAAEGAYGAAGSGVLEGPGFDTAVTAMEGITAMTGPIPHVQFIERPENLARQRAWLVQPDAGTRHLAVVVVRPQALAPASPGTAGATTAYDLYVPANLDERAEAAIRGMLRDAIVSVRARAHGLDVDQLDALSQVQAGRSIAIARDGSERPSTPALDRLLPFGLILLMVVGVLGGGQFLLTTMVEEKSSRIIEVLLAAVSPIELLGGKILGQLGAVMVGMGLYLLVAFAALSAFALFGLVDPALLLLLFLLFIISFLVIGSVMVAAGAAVNDMRDAQSLLTPFVFAVAAIAMLSMPISMNPNSKLAMTLSFTPVVNTFAIIARLASTSPPPAWQVWLSIAIGLVSAVAAIWLAAKVFRIALLLHGRPPNLATLLRWAMSPER
jgi:ABC-2 type transport system permease protein